MAPKNLKQRIERAAFSRTYRVLLATFGGYTFTVGFFAFFSVLLALLGESPVEAMFWAVLSSFLIYTLVAIWAAATPRPWITSAIIVGGGAAMIGVAPILAAQLGQ